MSRAFGISPILTAAEIPLWLDRISPKDPLLPSYDETLADQPPSYEEATASSWERRWERFHSSASAIARKIYSFASNLLFQPDVAETNTIIRIASQAPTDPLSQRVDQLAQTQLQIDIADATRRKEIIETFLLNLAIVGLDALLALLTYLYAAGALEILTMISLSLELITLLLDIVAIGICVAFALLFGGAFIILLLVAFQKIRAWYAQLTPTPAEQVQRNDIAAEAHNIRQQIDAARRQPNPAPLAALRHNTFVSMIMARSFE